MVSRHSAYGDARDDSCRVLASPAFPKTIVTGKSCGALWQQLICGATLGKKVFSKYVSGMSGPSASPFCIINGAPATWEKMLPVATQNYGHITMVQMRGGMVRGLEHHLARLKAANRELFGRTLAVKDVLEGLRAVGEARPDATVRVNVFAGEEAENVMVTAMEPIEPNWIPARFALIAYERDMAHLKHVGSFGLSLRQRQAVAEGYDGAVFYDRNNEISEATIWNVGFFDGDTVVWPSAPSLRGISQIIIDEGLLAAGVKVRYEPVHTGSLSRYDSAFLTNSITFGRLLSSIGEVTFDTCTDASQIIRRAYESTPFLPIPSN